MSLMSSILKSIGPYPTTIPVGPGSTITVTEATELTITACPCTLTKPGIITTARTQITTVCPEATTVTLGTVVHTLPAGTVSLWSLDDVQCSLLTSPGYHSRQAHYDCSSTRAY